MAQSGMDWVIYSQSFIKQEEIHTDILVNIGYKSMPEGTGGTPCFPLSCEHFINTSKKHDPSFGYVQNFSQIKSKDFPL